MRFLSRAAAFCAVAAGLVLGTNPTSIRAVAPGHRPNAVTLHDPYCVLLADPRIINTFVPPTRGGSDHPAALATATFVVNYSGFTPEAEATFQYVVDLWAMRVVSPVPIVINAQFTPLPAGTLGSAGATQVWRDFSGAPMAGTWYPVAIANSRAGVDLNPSLHDISAQFSSTFDWNFDINSSGTPGQYDFATVVMHEIGHGLGFFGSGREHTPGSGLGNWGHSYPSPTFQPVFNGFPNIYDRFVITGGGQAYINTALFANPSTALFSLLESNNLFFAGPQAQAANGGPSPKIYSAAPYRGGSTYSHFDEATYPPGTPHSLMTPFLASQERIHDPGGLTLGVYRDSGWLTSSGCAYALAPTSANYTPAGGGGSFTLTTSSNCPWTATSNVPWVTVTGAAAGTGSATINFTVASNPSSSARNGQITVGDQNFLISQAGVVCTLSVNPTSDFVDAPGGTRTLTVVANVADCAWSVQRFVDWVTVSPSSGAGTMTISYTAAPNTTGAPRTTTIVVGGLPVIITQRAAGPKPFLDLDGNGVGDALLYNPGTGQFSMRTGTADGFSLLTGGTWATGWTIKKARFNSDNLDDLFYYNATTGFWYKAMNVGNGVFSFYGYRWAANWTPVVGDWNGDGLSDVFIYNQTNGNWFRAMTNPGAPDFLYTAGAWAPGWSLFTGDFDGSGTDDLFIYNRNGMADANSGKWFRVMTATDGSFGYIPGDIRWANDWQPVAGDWNGDGADDLFIYRPSGQWFKVFFTPASASYTPGAWAAGWQIRVGRFNTDSLDDLHLYNPVNGQSFTVLNGVSGNFIYYFTQWGATWNVNLSDFNGDGLSDVLLYNSTTGTGFQANTIVPGMWSYVAFSGWPTGMTVIAN